MSDCGGVYGVLQDADANLRLDCPDCCLHPAVFHPANRVLVPGIGKHRDRVVVLLVVLVMVLLVVMAEVGTLGHDYR